MIGTLLDRCSVAGSMSGCACSSLLELNSLRISWAVSVVGAEPWPAGEPFDDVSDHQAAGLDTKKKTLGATERDEAARSRWRELMKQVDARHSGGG